MIYWNKQRKQTQKKNNKEQNESDTTFAKYSMKFGKTFAIWTKYQWGGRVGEEVCFIFLSFVSFRFVFFLLEKSLNYLHIKSIVFVVVVCWAFQYNIKKGNLCVSLYMWMWLVSICNENWRIVWSLIECVRFGRKRTRVMEKAGREEWCWARQLNKLVSI